MLKFVIFFTAIIIISCENKSSDVSDTLEFTEAEIRASSAAGDIGFEGLWSLSLEVVEGATQYLPDRFIEITSDGQIYILRCSTDEGYYRSEKYRGILSEGRIIFDNDRKYSFGLQGEVRLRGDTLEVFDDLLGVEYIRVSLPPEICDFDAVKISEVTATSLESRVGLDMNFVVDYNLRSRERAKVYLGYSYSSGDEYELVDTKIFIDGRGRGSLSFSVEDFPASVLALESTNFYIFLMSYTEENYPIGELAYDYIKLQEK